MKFTIGKLAKQAEIGVQAIRYYERQGLLIPAGRTESGYRLYDQKALNKLRFICNAKGLGFSLNEIKGLLDLEISSGDHDKTCKTVKTKAEAKLRNVETKIEMLESIKNILSDLLKACDKRKPAEECPILRGIDRV